MTRQFILRPRAERDIRSAYEWYESHRAGLGNEFLAALRERLEAVRGHPDQVPLYIAGSGAPWCRDFRISFSTSRGRNVSPCSTTREILRSGLGASTVPANHRIDTDRFAAGHAER